MTCDSLSVVPKSRTLRRSVIVQVLFSTLVEVTVNEAARPPRLTIAVRRLTDLPGSRLAAVRIAMSCVAFGVLTVLCWHRIGPITLDRRLLHGYVPSPSSAWFRAANAITEAGSPVIVTVAGLATATALWQRHRSLPWAVACVAAPGIAGAIEATMKFIVERHRPVTAFLAGEAGNGFPSGHAAGFSALAIVAALGQARLSRRNHRMLVTVAVLASLTIANTRVVVGAHYPTDVLAGLLLGFGVADACAYLATNLNHLATVDRVAHEKPSEDRDLLPLP